MPAVWFGRRMEGPLFSYSTNNGSTWTASTGINTGVDPEADRVNSNKFYAYDATNGNVLVSTNGGTSFSTDNLASQRCRAGIYGLQE